MTMSPKPKPGPTFANVTVNRGVEAKEIEIGNAQFDIDSSSSVAAGDVPRPTSPALLSDQSASFVQVVVQKRHSGAPRARLPDASSPACATPAASALHKTMYANSGVPAAVVMACPALSALHQHSFDKMLRMCVNEANAETLNRAAGDAPCAAQIQQEHRKSKGTIRSFVSKKISGAAKEDPDCFCDAPERIEVHRFLRGEECMSSRVAETSRLERVALRAARPAAALLRELLALPRLLFRATLASFIQLERCVLESACAAACGLLEAASDAALKPALAATHNALVAPTLACATHVAAAAREATRPLAAALGDALEPPARLLSALRLVHVEGGCRCSPSCRRNLPQSHRSNQV